MPRRLRARGFRPPVAGYPAQAHSSPPPWLSDPCAGSGAKLLPELVPWLPPGVERSASSIFLRVGHHRPERVPHAGAPPTVRCDRVPPGPVPDPEMRMNSVARNLRVVLAIPLRDHWLAAVIGDVGLLQHQVLIRPRRPLVGRGKAPKSTMVALLTSMLPPVTTSPSSSPVIAMKSRSDSMLTCQSTETSYQSPVTTRISSCPVAAPEIPAKASCRDPRRRRVSRRRSADSGPPPVQILFAALVDACLVGDGIGFGVMFRERSRRAGRTGAVMSSSARMLIWPMKFRRVITDRHHDEIIALPRSTSRPHCPGDCRRSPSSTRHRCRPRISGRRHRRGFAGTAS